MPELPEVEVLKRSLEPQLLGERFEQVEVLCRALREPVSGRRLASRLCGRAIVGLRRRAKYLWIDAEGGSTLVIHLGMSGRLTLSSLQDRSAPEPHEHVRWQLASGRRLRYRDPRRFGLVLALASHRLESDAHFSHLGLEPLGGELDGSILRRLARGRRGPVKNFLMDARIVVGVGNIYASEALHRAGIHPLRSVARIGAGRWNGLAEAVRAVLEDAIEQGGTTLNDFTNGQGESGYFQVSLAVYGREAEACRCCGAPIRRLVLAGRSTYYCPSCQH